MTTHRFFALFAVLAFGACDESGTNPTDADLTLDEAAELALIEDAGSMDIAPELVDVTADVAANVGDPGSAEGRSLNLQARARFQAALESLHQGNRRQALAEARHARRLAAQALVAAGGAEAVEALIERLEELLATLDVEDDDVFDDPERLKARLEAIVAGARELLEQGNLVAAAERALLGEQLVRFHRGRRDHRGDVRPERARLAVDLARTAVALAERLIASDDTPVRDVGSSDVPDRQTRWLAHAHRMLGLAERALESGHFARAVHFAYHAHWSALKAVILPGGITETELDAMVVVANNLYEQAQEAVGDDPTELQQRLLALAGRLIERGEQMLEDGYPRGVAPLWRAAVISRWLIG
jgi:HEPN domain-containing protein